MIIYEPHPVTPERKAELRAQGYKIIDAQFAPEELSKPMSAEERRANFESKFPDLADSGNAPTETTKRGRKAKG